MPSVVYWNIVQFPVPIEMQNVQQVHVQCGVTASLTLVALKLTSYIWRSCDTRRKINTFIKQLICHTKAATLTRTKVSSVQLSCERSMEKTSN